ncbi:MAG: MATE family efflux transporter [Lachnospiraceae bacterium]|nr:MATE family efflux transporter [Lachnospiraceae bacterium]
MKNNSVLEKGSFWELLLKLSVPSVVIILIMLIYNIADTYFIGQTGDPNKISAISLGMPLFSILSGIGTLFGNGGTTSVSIALGEKNYKKVRQITGFCFTGALVIGLTFFAVIFLFSNQIAVMLGADATTMADTITYIKVFSFACPLVLLTQSFGSIARADGDGATPMVANLIGTLSNIVLDAVFILIFKWDVFGAAFATVLGNVITSLLLLRIMLKKKREFLPHISRASFSTKIMFPVITLGLPMTFSTLLGSVSHIIVNRQMMVHGSYYLAAQSVAGKVNMVITMLIMGVCMGMQPAISYNFGAKNYKRMKSIVKSTGTFTIVLGLVLTAIIFVFKNSLVAAFIDDAEIISIGQTFVIASVIIGPVYGIYQLCQTFLQSTGKASFAIIASLLDKGLIYLPVVFILNNLYGPYGIAFSHAVTMLFTIVVALFLALKWNKKLTQDAEQHQAGSIIGNESEADSKTTCA